MNSIQDTIQQQPVNVVDSNESSSTPPSNSLNRPPDYINPAFVSDDTQPPPYHLICPSSDGERSNCYSSEIKPTTTISSADFSVNENETPPPPPSLPPLMLQQDDSQRYEPIRYEDMFYSGAITPSCRFLFQRADEMLPPSFEYYQNSVRGGGRDDNGNSGPGLVNASSAATQLQLLRERKIRKQFSVLFPKSYLLKHCILVSGISLVLILFQIILMYYESILSELGSGIWCGIINLLTLLFSVITLKYCKMNLLIALIVAHFVCIMVNLGALVIINCLAATRYNTCSYYASYMGSMQFMDRTFCNNYNNQVKYINISVIVLGGVCMLLFVNFFFKLIAVFNYSQTNSRE